MQADAPNNNNWFPWEQSNRTAATTTATTIKKKRERVHSAPVLKAHAPSVFIRTHGLEPQNNAQVLHGQERELFRPGHMTQRAAGRAQSWPWPVIGSLVVHPLAPPPAPPDNFLDCDTFKSNGIGRTAKNARGRWGKRERGRT